MAPTDPDAAAHSVTGATGHRRPAHTARPRGVTVRLAAALAGVIAVAAAIGVGTAALLRSSGPTTSTVTSARHITATAPVIPLSGRQIADLVGRPPDYGVLSDPARRASCLAGLGYPAASAVLGARPIDVEGKPGVLLVLAGDTDETLIAYAVALNCSAADTGLLADTTVARR